MPDRLSPEDQIALNWNACLHDVHESCALAGRPLDAVRIVGVAKYVDESLTAALIRAGCRDVGESRPQSLWSKAETLAEVDCRWHLVGHLQRNKLRRTLPLLSLLHSVDSRRLLRALDAETERTGQTIDVLLEVNISGDKAKTGFDVGDVVAAVEAALPLQRVRVRGLMGMASREGGSTQARRDFAALRQLRDRLAEQFANQISLDELSMGMSKDFAAAIAEGATIIRVGSRLFEGVPGIS